MHWLRNPAAVNKWYSKQGKHPVGFQHVSTKVVQDLTCQGGKLLIWEQDLVRSELHGFLGKQYPKSIQIPCVCPHFPHENQHFGQVLS